jgi:hypothetical protein
MTPPTHTVAPPAWSTSLFSLLHPVQIAVVEAFEWIEEPMSATVLFDVFGRHVLFGTVSYHVRRLADAGVLVMRYSEPRRGTREHFYALAL